MEKFLVDNLVQEMGYAKPTPIQMQAIPALLAKRSLLACAPTGSGKTASFVVPLISLLKRPQRKSGVRGLILSPTRELAVQTFDQLEILCKGRKFKNFLLSSSSASIPSTGQNCGSYLWYLVILLLLSNPQQILSSRRLCDCCVLWRRERLTYLGAAPPLAPLALHFFQ
jgi:hypothetical protein